MTPRQFEKALKDVGLTQRGAAKFLGINERTVRHWVKGTNPVPRAIELLLKVMISYRTTADRVLEFC